jgi:hypothetical protein
MPQHNAFTRRLIAAGCTPKAPLTEPQILIERLEAAAQPGADSTERRRLLIEAAAFIREHHIAKPGRAA